MSLQLRLSALITAIGADIKSLKTGISGAEMQLEFGAWGQLTTRVGGVHRPIKGGTYTIVGVTATTGTAPTGATTFLTVDVSKNDVTIFTNQANRPTFASGAKIAHSGTPDVATVTDNDVISVDIDAVGNTTPGADLSVIVRLVRTA